MTTTLVVGLGAVGARAARQLSESGGVQRVLVTDRRRGRADSVAAAIDGRVEATDWTVATDLPSEVDVLVCATPAGDDVAVIRAGLRAGIPITTAVDDHEAIRALIELDSTAQQADVAVVVGCGLAPGLADVLARHAADSLDTVEEIHVARFGAAGPACEESVRRALRDHPLEWRGGAWYDDRRRIGHELVWFPDPIGARECELVAGGVWCLAEAFPDATRISVRFGEPPGGRRFGPFVRRGSDEASWGAARVEVWGQRGGVRTSIVYGVIERTAAAAGTVLALATLATVGLLPDADRVKLAGVHGLATVLEPIPFLAELARRGVKAAAFEGVTVR